VGRQPAPFITFEGGEGTGKSTQIRALAALLSHHGIPCLVTREPGGSAGAEKIRSLIVEGDVGRWDALTEYLLLSAARRDHLVKTIKPALAAGIWVLCDRYIDSSRVYQRLRGLDTRVIEEIYAQLSEGTEPDLTFIFDLDPEVGLARAAARREGEDRFEQLGLSFHKEVRNAFLEHSRTFSGRCCVVDASLSLKELTEILWHEAEARFLKKEPL
jgi:dTMP kinase